MNKSLLCLLSSLVMMVLAVSCNVDDSYDLSKVEDSNLGFGTEETTFSIPLFNMTFDVAGLLGSSVRVRAVDSSDGLSTDEVFELVSDLATLMPSNLSGEYEDGVDLTRLDEKEYVEMLIDDLFDELATNDDKRLELFKMLKSDSNDYSESLTYLEEIDIDINTMTTQECADKLGVILNTSSYDASIDEVKSQIVDLILVESENIATDFDYEQKINGIDIEENVYDIIASGLNNDDSKINIMAKISTNLPLNVSVTLYLHYFDSKGDEVIMEVNSDEDLNNLKGEIKSTEDLDAILENLTVKAVISFNNYVPESGTLDLEGKYVTISLIAYKKGSLII